MLGLSNGVRELMLLIPQADAGRDWQSKAVGGNEPAWQLGADVFLYAAGRTDLRYRGDSHLVDADPTVKPARTVPRRPAAIRRQLGPRAGRLAAARERPAQPGRRRTERRVGPLRRRSTK